MTRADSRPYEASGFQMISSFSIQNFRCFDLLEVDRVRRFNVIVGDNGAGKTALLEALFLTLAGNVDVSLRLRQQRGFDGNFAGSTRGIEEALWRDFFFDYDWNKPLTVQLNGSGPEARSMMIARGMAPGLIPFENAARADSGAQQAPLQFTWTDAAGNDHSYVPVVNSQGLQVPPAQEDLPTFFLFPANSTPGAAETAARFSELSTANREGLFVEIFKREFPFIKGLNIEVTGGFPVIHVSFEGQLRKQPLNTVSGGINRAVAIMIALAAQPKSVVLVDEIEDGIYYRHKTGLWRGILELARKNDCQMFLTTHDEEWLAALSEATENEVSDIALWRCERLESGRRVLKQFSGRQAMAAIKTGEVR